MKKFSFSLENVLNYKGQLLDAHLTEHGSILSELRKQEEFLNQLRQDYDAFIKDFQREKERGITIQNMLNYQTYAHSLDQHIRKEEGILQLIKRREEIKRQQVVEARKETATIEKLKEKKQEQYNKEALKREEQFIEEFVSNTRGKLRIS